MHILITGGGGFIGSQLAKELLQRKQLKLAPSKETASITSITVADIIIPDTVRKLLGKGAIPVRFEEGDIADPEFLESCVLAENAAQTAVFHLAAMVSGQAEQEFDEALRVNLRSTERLLELLRHQSKGSRLVFASSLATFGGHAMTPVVSDRTKQIPQTTYGMTKLMGELLINDYARKEFVDGRAARLPTIFIRPGKPNAAASSFASSLFREPLTGKACHIPVPRSQGVPLLSYVQVVDCFIKLLEADANLLGDDRTVTLPSTQYTIEEMIQALEEVADKRGIALGELVDAPDEVICRIVQGWPIGTDADRAQTLGMSSDPSLKSVIERFIDDFLKP